MPRSSASGRNRSDEHLTLTDSIIFDASFGVAPNTGIQRAILLSRYVNLMQQWIEYERQNVAVEPGAGWEETSVPLVVSAEYPQTFLTAFELDSDEIGDPDLDQVRRCCSGSSTGRRRGRSDLAGHGG